MAATRHIGTVISYVQKSWVHSNALAVTIYRDASQWTYQAQAAAAAVIPFRPQLRAATLEIAISRSQALMALYQRRRCMAVQAQQLAGERALQQIEAERDAYQAQAAATAADLFRAQKRGATLNLQLAGARHRLRAALEPEAVPGAGDDVAAADETQQDGSLEVPTAAADMHSGEDDDETAALRAAVRAEQVQQPFQSTFEGSALYCTVRLVMRRKHLTTCCFL